MNFRRIKHTLLRLSLQEKIIGVGAIVIMIGCFLPWYSTSNIVDSKIITEYGLSGDLGVIGFVIFLMSLLGLLAMVSENMHFPFPKFGHKRENILFFFLGQTAFLSLLTLAIYTKRSLDFTDANLRFGIYLVIVAAFFSALATFSLIRKTKQKEVLEFFEPEVAALENEEDIQEEDIEELREGEESSIEAQIEEEFKEETDISTPEEALTFQNDLALIEEIEKEKTTEVVSPEIEEKTKALKEFVEPLEKEVPQEEKKPLPDQSNYFTKEAGIGGKKEEKNSPNTLSMGFYEDK